jgi:hypothetical protein
MDDEVFIFHKEKNVFDLPIETGMLDCKPLSTPIEKNHRILADSVIM